MDAIYEECRSDWSHQVSVVVTTRWLQYDQTLAPSAKGVACETTLEPVSIYYRFHRQYVVVLQARPTSTKSGSGLRDYKVGHCILTSFECKRTYESQALY